jgi:hypothetical protein
LGLLTRALIIALATAFATATCSANRSTPAAPRSKASISRILYADSTSDSLRPVQRIVISVKATATQDSKTGLWTYAYTLRNDVQSRNVIDRFAIRPVSNIVQVIAPPHWLGSHGYGDDSTTVEWGVIEVGPEPPGWSGLDTYIGPYHPRPGETISGFKIVSSKGPQVLSFFAQGFDTLLAGGEEGRESPPDMFMEGVTGETIGPAL